MKKLLKNEMKKIIGGVFDSGQACTAKAYCGSNGSVSCTGYAGCAGAGCTAADDVGVACCDQSGVMQWYSCAK